MIITLLTKYVFTQISWFLTLEECRLILLALFCTSNHQQVSRTTVGHKLHQSVLLHFSSVRMVDHVGWATLVVHDKDTLLTP